MPRFSIILPVKTGGYVAALDTLRQADLAGEAFEIILAEGHAPSCQRNLAAGVASGDVLYFLDDDSCIDPGNLQLCRTAMADERVAVVGGPSLTPPSDGRLQRLIGLALASVIGSGSVRNRYRSCGAVRETTEKELILCNLIIRRSVFLEMGGFDERLYPNEENELMDRIRSAGFKLLHVPLMVVQRSQRPTVLAFARQMFAYGRGRAQQTILSGSVSIVSFIPLLFNIYLLLLPFAAIIHPLFMVPLGVYVLVIVSATMYSMAATRNLETCGLLLLFPLMHVVNGCGLLRGLLGGVPAKVSDNSIKISRVKTFAATTW